MYVTAKRWGVIAVLFVLCFAPFQSTDFIVLKAEGQNSKVLQGPQDILLMGNSYTSANNLDNLVDGVMGAASVQTNVSSLTGGGLKLSQHASNVASSGHQWNTTLKGTSWDWVVLQDQSQVPGFPRTEQMWIDSKDGAIELNQAIERNGGETVLLMTWGRRDGDSTNSWIYPNYSSMQDELANGYLDYRDNMSSASRQVWVAPAGLAFQHIHDNIIADGGTPTDSGTLFHDLYSSDGSHPSLSGSYLAACVLYASITGDDPVGLTHSTSLSNTRALELQQAASATVFNETSHIDYPWQLQNQLPPINLSAIPDGALAFDWVQQSGTDDSDFSINDIVVSPTGDIFALGTASGDSSTDHTIGGCDLPEFLFLFVVKINSNRVCDWTANITGDDAEYNSGWEGGDISLDGQGNLYITGTLGSPKTGQGSGYYFESPGKSGKIEMSNCNGDCTIGFVAKLNSLGDWEWMKEGGASNYGHGFHSIDTFQNGSSIITGEYGNDILLSNAGGIGGGSSFSDSRQGTVTKNIVVAMIDTNGEWKWASFLGSNGNDAGYDVNIYDNNYAYISGTIAPHDSSTLIMFGNHSLNTTSESNRIAFVSKINQYGEWQWAKTWDSASSTSHGLAVDTDSIGNVFFAGTTYGTNKVNGIGYASGGHQNSFIAKLDSNGTWLWIEEVECSCTNSINSISVDVHDNVLVGGIHSAQIQMGTLQLVNAGGSTDIYLAKINSSGSWQFALSAGSTDSGDSVGGVFSDRAGNGYISGAVDNGPEKYGTIKKQNNDGDDWFIAKLSSDYDGDGEPDVNDDDDDDDYIIDAIDDCHFSPIGFESVAAFDHDSDGCRDTDEDDDDDGDGVNDSIDDCERGMTRWTSTNLTDLDSDGCMDALEDFDDDADGFEDYLDFCPRLAGNSTNEFEKGCPDTDGDGRPDILDPFVDDPTEWQDTDGDRAGDNSDEFPYDASQQSDDDGDGYGDNLYGNNGDSCRTTPGTSIKDRFGCPDSDGDGWSDEGDDFPNDPNEYLDTDGDEVPDHMDEFPFDPTQWRDSDGDGYGDNSKGNQGDIWPDDQSRHFDSDRDGIADNYDDFPFDPTQWIDMDGDGMGDNPMGIGADHFPNDPTQWGDIDGDGYGDNQSGNNSDAFPIDSTQWSDFDGDGYGDNPTGRLYDMFPNNPTQWEDNDGDGLGDNQSGTNADPYLNDEDNDGYNDTIDILPKFASPGDLDADECMDGDDAFPSNPLECLDSDGDGIGNNADADDDNDEWTDADEIRSGTDPLNANDTPVDSFEIQIGNIGLGAWDLIGMFGGIPLFSWIVFGLFTRNGRCSRYEEAISNSKTREELDAFAERWEFSLMLRLLGPHQGIRLERLRAEVDDELEHAERLLGKEEGGEITSIDHTSIVEEENKNLPTIISAPAFDAVADEIDVEGYYWIEYSGAQWYKTEENSEWIIFEK